MGDQLTEVFEGLFYLFGGQVEGSVGVHKWRVQPIILFVTEDGVGSQLVDRQLLLQQADNLKFRQVSTVTYICTKTRQKIVFKYISKRTKKKKFW